MQCASVLAPEGRGNALLAVEDASQAGPAGIFSLLAETSADGLHQLVGDHGDEQMPVGAPLGAVEDGAQAEFGLEGAEHRLDIGQDGVNAYTAKHTLRRFLDRAVFLLRSMEPLAKFRI